jgi:hypothetical protein
VDDFLGPTADPNRSTGSTHVRPNIPAPRDPDLATVMGNYQTLPIKAAGNLGVLLYDRVDGLDIGHGTVQGPPLVGRRHIAMDRSRRLRGRDRGPGFPAPYMWNRNSPYQYVDPTGYDACTFGRAGTAMTACRR